VGRPGFVAVAVLVSPLALTRHASYVAGLYVSGALVTLLAIWGLFWRDRRWHAGGTVTRHQFVVRHLRTEPVVNSDSIMLGVDRRHRCRILRHRARPGLLFGASLNWLSSVGCGWQRSPQRYLATSTGTPTCASRPRDR
jgi:hypothetical protein